MRLITCLMATLIAGQTVLGTPPEERPKAWAQPVKVEGAPNLHRVSDKVYRSAQPTREGMQNLKDLGVKTVINLRSFASDRSEISGTGLNYEHITMKAWHPERKEVIKFLKIATAPKQGPVLVHCLHGADRTGAMCAIYRIAVEDWSKEDALREMTEGGYGFHEVFKKLPKWIDELDIEAIRQEVGIKPSLRNSDGASTATSK